MRRLLSGVLLGLVYLYLLAPILIVIPVSFSEAAYLVFPPKGLSVKWYLNFFRTRELTDALFLSVRLGLAATLVATVLGTLAAIALVRYRVPGKEGLRTFLLAPMILPTTVLGIAFLIYFTRIGLANSFFGLLVAHVVVITPYVIRTVSATLAGYDATLEQAAQSLGATPLRAFCTVTLPLIRPGILAGAIFAFVLSFDELVVSLFLSGPRLSTLPVQIYNYIEFTSDPTIAAISTLLVVMTTAVVLLTERFMGVRQFV